LNVGDASHPHFLNLPIRDCTWSSNNSSTYFNRHILRLGGFHSLSCFLSSIGKLWADSGLRDLLVDSGVFAGNTAETNTKEINP
jgi:hypothetical protein